MSYTNRCFTQKLCYTQTQCFAQKPYSYVLAGPVQVLFAACRITLSRVAGGTRRRQMNFWKTHRNSLMIFAWDSPCKSAILTVLEELKSPIWVCLKIVYPEKSLLFMAISLGILTQHFQLPTHFETQIDLPSQGTCNWCRGLHISLPHPAAHHLWAPGTSRTLWLFNSLLWKMARLKIIYDDLWWFMMVYDDSWWWFMMIHDDLHVTSCYKWWIP